MHLRCACRVDVGAAHVRAPSVRDSYYNLLLALGLFVGVGIGSPHVKATMLGAVAGAGLIGGLTAGKMILFIQFAPAFLGFIFAVCGQMGAYCCCCAEPAADCCFPSWWHVVVPRATISLTLCVSSAVCAYGHAILRWCAVAIVCAASSGTDGADAGIAFALEGALLVGTFFVGMVIKKREDGFKDAARASLASDPGAGTTYTGSTAS